MAIGKTNAFATVTAPKVDFGEVALNAQKFQQEADEKRLAKAAAKPKEKDFKPQDIGVNLGDSGIQKINSAIFSGYNGILEDYNYSYQSEDNVGMMSNKAKATQLKDKVTNVKGAVDRFNLMIKEGKISPASQGYINAMGALISGNIADARYVKEQNEVEAIFYQTNSKGEVVLDENNMPIPLDIVDSDGKKMSKLTASQIINFENYIIPEVNIFGEEGKANGVVHSIARNVGLTETTDVNGRQSITKVFLEDDDVESINRKSREMLLSDKRVMAAIAYKYDPERFKEPKKEYTSEEYDFVADKIKNDVINYYKFETKESVKIGGGRSGTGKSEPPVTVNTESFYKSTQSFQSSKLIDKAGKGIVREDKVLTGETYELSFVSGEQNRKLSTFGILIGKDGKKHFFIKAIAGQTGSSRYGSGGAGSGAGDTEMGMQPILATGENRARIDNILVSANVLNPDTGQPIKTYLELYDYALKRINKK
jgi:hypothetical protein